MSVPLSQRSRILLDSEYYTYTQPPPQQPRDVASQLGVTQPPQPSRPPSAQEYIASTEHLFEDQAPSPVSEFSIIKTGAGNIYVYTSAGWQKLEYNPQSNTYSLAPASLSDITAEVQRLGGTGYKLDPQLAEKLAEQEPHALMWYGVEEALRYAKLREVFTELSREKWVTEADVRNVVRERLEKYGWSVRSEEDFEKHAALARAVFENPDVWKAIEADINRQLEEAKPKMEELQRFYEAKALKQWDAERENLLRQQIEQRYKFFEHADPITLAVSGLGRGAVEGFTLGLFPRDWLPKDTGHFYEALFERYRQLSLRPLEELLEKAGLRPLLDAARFMATATGSPVSPLLSHPDVWAPVAKNYLVGQEKIELEVLQKQLTPGKRLAYGFGYGLGTVLGLGALNLTASKTIGPVAQKALGRLAQHVAEHPESNLAKIAEKLHLVQREQLVPKTVDAWIERLSSESFAQEGSVTKWRFAVRVAEWGRVEELLGGRKVPESLKLGEREITLLPLEGGRKVPFAGPGSVYAVEVRDFTLVKGGSAPREVLGVYGVGTENNSLVTATRVTLGQRPDLPHTELIKIVGAKVDYAKILQQAQGGLPRAVLFEEGDIFASISRTPKIPVKEAFTPARIPSLPPLVLPPKLPMKEEERREPQAASLPLKIPSVERASPPDISIKPLPMPFSSTRPLQTFKPEVTELTAPKTGEFSLQLPRTESRAAELTAPKLDLPPLQQLKLEPKLEPKVEPRTEPRLPARERQRLPRLPLLVFGGTRDLPIAKSLKMLSREWLVRWFGPGAPEVLPAARPRRGKGRRGGRR